MSERAICGWKANGQVEAAAVGGALDGVREVRGRAPLWRVIAVDVQQKDAAAARLQVPPEQGAQEGPPLPCMSEGC